MQKVETQKKPSLLSIFVSLCLETNLWCRKNIIHECTCNACAFKANTNVCAQCIAHFSNSITNIQTILYKSIFILLPINIWNLFQFHKFSIHSQMSTSAIGGAMSICTRLSMIVSFVYLVFMQVECVHTCYAQSRFTVV